MSGYATHPLAALVPEASDTEKAALADDIRTNGLRVPVVLHEGKVLDGRHRYEACRAAGVECTFRDYEGDDPAAFVLSMNLARRHLTESQRAMVGARLVTEKRGGDRKSDRCLNSGIDQVAAARATNTSRFSVQQAARVIRGAAPSVVAAVDAGEVAVSDAAAVAGKARTVQEAAIEAVRAHPEKQARATGGAGRAKTTLKREAERAERRQAKADAMSRCAPADPRLFTCPVADLHRDVDAGSVDAIITDPPYPREYVHTYGELATFAAHALRPGGLLLAIASTPYMRDILNLMHVDGLEYRWMIAYYQQQARQQVHAARVSVQWKPWLAYTRTGGQPEGYSTDFIDSGPHSAADKQRHHWGQTPAGIGAVIDEWLKAPGSLICDPFCGGGSTLVAAVRLGHRVIGADVDAGCVALTRKALQEAGQ